MAEINQPISDRFGEFSVRIARFPQIDSITLLTTQKREYPIEYSIEGEDKDRILKLLHKNRELLASHLAKEIAEKNTSLVFQNIVFEEENNRIKVLLDASQWIDRFLPAREEVAIGNPGAVLEFTHEIKKFEVESAGLAEVIRGIAEDIRRIIDSLSHRFKKTEGEGK